MIRLRCEMELIDTKKPKEENELFRCFRDGECARILSRIDWSQTSLGPTEKWPQTMRAAIGLCFASRFPTILFCGKDFHCIYNDAYISIAGTKHPEKLGVKGCDMWAEVWDTIGPMLEGVLTSGKSTWNDDLLLLLNRSHFIEENYFTFSYTPIGLECQNVCGVFTAVSWTTSRYIGERRLKILSELGAKSSIAQNVQDACQKMIDVLAKSIHDAPFSQIYLLNDEETSLELCCSTLSEGTCVTPSSVDLLDNKSRYPVKNVLDTGKHQIVDLEGFDKNALPTAPWGIPPNKAIILPILAPGQQKPTGVLIAGISPRRLLDEHYTSFYNIVAAQIATAISNSRAHEQERKKLDTMAKLDEAKTAFFTNVSHEFRTPLTLMLGPLEDALKDPTYQPAQKETIQMVQRNALRLLKLVNSLLDFSKIESLRMKVALEATDLAPLTENLASTFRSTIERAGLQFNVKTEPLSQKVYVDQEMWEKIIFNLLSNSFKFTLKGSITLTLQEKDNKAELCVADTGVGIPENEQSHVFERFYRVAGVQGRSYEGTGIGLALVHELVKLQGGSMRFHSKPGEGTSFYVAIPYGTKQLKLLQEEGACRKPPKDVYCPGEIGMAFVEEASKWYAGDSESGPTRYPSDPPIHMELSKPKFGFENGLKTDTVLLVDDNADMRKYIINLLQNEPWILVPKHDGLEALNYIQEHHVDLVLTDVMMPHMDGFQLLQALRSDPKTQYVPVIMLSARVGEEDKVEGLQAGADDYLVKPFSGKELRTRLKTHLELGRLRRNLLHRVDAQQRELYNTTTQLQMELNEKVQTEKALATETTRALAAEEYQQHMEDFVNTICHEIRNPLNGIYGGVDLLQQTITETETLHAQHASRPPSFQDTEIAHKLESLREMVNNVSQCATQQKIIVDDVLDFSKIQSNKVEIQSIPYNPMQVLQTVLQMFNPQLAMKNLQLNLFLDGVNLWVKGDPHRLTQIITNLISNAIKFTHEGAITLNANSVLTETPPGGVILEFCVEDTGIGMTPEEQTQLFRKFVQANRHIGMRYGGTGLGLVISKRLVELMGGSISVDSRIGKGTRFTFTIQTTKLTTEEMFQYNLINTNRKRSLSTIPASPTRANDEGNSKNILVVEDNLINQQILLRYLQNAGHFCTVASNGLEALERFQKFKFDLIFMDIEMPGMNGLDATQQIRKLESDNNRTPIPIVGLSGNARKEQIEAAKLVGMSDYLTKPYHKDDLYKILATLCVEHPPKQPRFE